MKPNWYLEPCPSPDKDIEQAACNHQMQLTKPPGSLGTLEGIATRFASWQNTIKPSCDKVLIRVFAGDHGVCKQNVSAFPQEVTAQMVQNFVSGGAAINVLAKRVDADFAAVNTGVISDLDDAPLLHNHPVMRGTRDFSVEPAMNMSELEQCLDLGRNQINEASPPDLFIGGEMGIGNTSSASALYCAYLKMTPHQTTGPGTGLDRTGVARKASLIERSLDLHYAELNDPIRTLAALGGTEIVALVGAYIRAAQLKVPSLVDGFITTAAALAAININPGTRPWMIFAHKSAEPAHQLALDHLDATPLLDIGMRLGEGSGAALAVHIIQSAIDLHNNMATFDSAGVSQS